MTAIQSRKNCTLARLTRLPWIADFLARHPIEHEFDSVWERALPAGPVTGEALTQGLRRATDADPIAITLQQLRGIGPVLALTIRAEVGDIRRFPTGAQLASYAGLLRQAGIPVGVLIAPLIPGVNDAPGQIDNAVVVAASSRLTAQNIAFSAVAREAIMRDPDFADGGYAGTERTPRIGLAIARMMAHITYLSEEAMSEKFGRRLQGDEPPGSRMGLGVDFQVESYLNHQGSVFLDRFDALSYLYLTRSMDYFDVFADPGAPARIASGGTRFLVLSFDTDWRFDTSHSRRIVRTLEHAGASVTFREIRSAWGHDSFLLVVPGYHETVSAFLNADGRGLRLALRHADPKFAPLMEELRTVVESGAGPATVLEAVLERHGLAYALHQLAAIAQQEEH